MNIFSQIKEHTRSRVLLEDYTSNIAIFIVNRNKLIIMRVGHVSNEKDLGIRETKTCHTQSK